MGFYQRLYNIKTQDARHKNQVARIKTSSKYQGLILKTEAKKPRTKTQDAGRKIQDAI